MALNQFQNLTVDKRRLSDQDKANYNRGAREDQKSLARTKARKAALNRQEQREERTVTSTPGSGGFLRGRAIQQLRLREIGREKRRAEALRNI